MHACSIINCVIVYVCTCIYESLPSPLPACIAKLVAEFPPSSFPFVLFFDMSSELVRGQLALHQLEFAYLTYLYHDLNSLSVSSLMAWKFKRITVTSHKDPERWTC